jgi:2-oxo-3-hexenedioate decarboxylase
VSNRSNQSPTPASIIAAEVLAAFDSVRSVAPFSGRVPGFDLDLAYAATAELRLMRQARGETQVGRKIGFTNRNIWTQYGVDGPIWGDMFASTVHALTGRDDRISLARFVEPQIEPEIAFKLAAAPKAGMDESALLDCIEWVAHGFEIVQSIFPGWRFTAADTVVAGGLHGGLLLGPPMPLDRMPARELKEALVRCEVALLRDGAVIDRGRGANVLDGPLSALRYLVETLARDRFNPPLAAGEIVTTGTLTAAHRVKTGETWSTALSGIPLAGLSATFG